MPAHRGAKALAVVAHAPAQLRAFVACQQFEHPQRRRRDATAPACSRTGTGASAAAAARRSPRGPDVKPPEAPPSALPSVPVTMSIRPSTPQSSGVPRPPSPTKPTACESSTITSAWCWSARSQIALEVGDDAVHREHAVGGDQLESRAGRFGLVQPGFEVGHVVVAVAQALRLAQPDAVDDAGVIQFVADDRVLLAEQRFEHAAVGIEAARIEDGVIGREECGERPFELLVHRLRAADEAHRCHAEAPAVEAFLRCRDQSRIVGQTEIIVGAEIQHFGARAARRIRDDCGL